MYQVSFLFISSSMFYLSFGYKNVYWWDTAVVYNVFPKSFKDSDNNGIGDIKGIKEKLPYIKDLGADALYLNPFFKSPMADTGYDVSDYKAIEPTLGSMKDIEDLIRECKKLGLKFMIDFVPNHTSDQHEWFQKSVKKIDPYTDYYIWRNASRFTEDQKAVPPNNWRCIFGGSTWEWNEERKQFYYHSFFKDQVDLDHTNENVVREMQDVLRFWLDKNVDGVRIDAIQFLVKNMSFPDEKLRSPELSPDSFNSFHHHDRLELPGLFNHLRTWRDLLDKYSAATDNQRRLIMVEYFTFSGKDVFDMEIKLYKNGADVVYNYLFQVQKVQLNATYLLDYLQRYTAALTEREYTMNWMLGVHDLPRYATQLGEEMADCYSMVMLLLPGNVFIYNGVEIGMKDYEQMPVKVDWRDIFRTPFQWDASPQAGFSNKKSTWLPPNPDYYRVNLKAEELDPKSHVNFYKRIIRTRRMPQFKTGNLQFYPISESVFAFSRYLIEMPDQEFFVLINTGSELECVALKQYITKLPEIVYVHTPTINSEHEQGEELRTHECFPMRPKSAMLLSTRSTSITIASALSPLFKPWMLIIEAFLIYGFLRIV